MAKPLRRIVPNLISDTPESLAHQLSKKGGPYVKGSEYLKAKDTRISKTRDRQAKSLPPDIESNQPSNIGDVHKRIADRIMGRYD
jgi:hypothetical protein